MAVMVDLMRSLSSAMIYSDTCNPCNKFPVLGGGYQADDLLVPTSTQARKDKEVGSFG